MFSNFIKNRILFSSQYTRIVRIYTYLFVILKTEKGIPRIKKYLTEIVLETYEPLYSYQQ